MAKIVGIFLMLFSLLSYADTCDPFTVKCRQASNALTKYHLSQLQMVGTIAQNDQLWAIIKTPNNHVYPISIGNAMGIEGGHVSQINSQQVTVKGKNIETLWLKCYS